MEDPVKSSDQPEATSTPPRRSRARVALLMVVVALSAGVAGGLATKAFGYGPSPWHAGAFMAGPVDPARVDQHVERMIKHLAIEVDATADQQARLIAIAKGATKDLLPLRDKAQANRREAVALFAAATVDRTAFERLRTEQIGLADTASKRIAQALADAAEVLTTEQRKEIAGRITSGPWGWWHRR